MEENPLGGFEGRAVARGSKGLEGKLLGEAHADFFHGAGPPMLLPWKWSRSSQNERQKEMEKKREAMDVWKRSETRVKDGEGEKSHGTRR